jgi:cyclopropane fatty-acyl-phospholipid synthase-like methyltransferase
MPIARWAAPLIVSWLSVPATPAPPSAAAQARASTAAHQSPSSSRERLSQEMLELAGVGPGDVVYDLGSVESIPVIAARRFGALAFGVGLEPAQADAARRAARDQGVARQARFIEGNLLTAAYAEATVVTLDLSPGLNLILGPILRRELRPGARIVSHRFGIGAWRADRTVHASDGTTLYLWTVQRQPVRAPDIFFVPTDQAIVEQMLDLAKVTASDVVYDLGSGDGRIVIIAAQRHGARGVGVEIDPALVAASRQVARDAQLAGRVRFIEGDLFDVDLTGATVVTLFLSESVNRRLEAKLKRELPNGARVVSRQFAIGDWAPDRTERAADGTSLFLWTIRGPR